MRELFLLDDDDDAPSWRDSALCAQTDPEAYFPEQGGSTRPAKQTCLSCPVRVDCLQEALDHDERWGIWGGLAPRERRQLKRRGPLAIAAALAEFAAPPPSDSRPGDGRRGEVA